MVGSNFGTVLKGTYLLQMRPKFLHYEYIAINAVRITHLLKSTDPSGVRFTPVMPVFVRFVFIFKLQLLVH